ncbi:MAG: MBL fold metallo-hydrolase RNA specificity domain-containing protein [Desulfatibacillaceae bacterium]
MIRVTCLGAAGGVTGSNYLVETTSGVRLLVDCGLFQGGKDMERRNWEPWAFDPSAIGYMFLTHAHIDHSGRIPKLVRDGFSGRIITSRPTAELCRILLLDSAHIQEMDAEWRTRKNKRKGAKEIPPLYTTPDAERSLQFFSPVDRDNIMEVGPGVRARLRNAGHILGSCILELWVTDGGDEIKIVFSGDLGRKEQLIVRDPHEIFDADYLFVESTYGNRLHKGFEESTRELLEAINYSYQRGEKVLIPAFAVERTQEILYMLSQFHRDGLLPDMPVYLDSPLAIKATEIFRKNKKYFDEEAQEIIVQGHDPLDMPNLHFTPTTAESIAINERKGPAIVLAGNGMCTAGRIKHHLKHNLWREGASLVIVGFQAYGTTGRQIVDGAKAVRIFGEMVAVGAKVFTIGGFSAHADQNDLLTWVGHFAESKPRVFAVHGESTASLALAEKIEERWGLTTYVPRYKEALLLKPREIEVEKPVEEEPDWSTMVRNEVVDLERDIRELKRRVEQAASSDKLGELDMERLRIIREELQNLAN